MKYLQHNNSTDMEINTAIIQPFFDKSDTFELIDSSEFKDQDWNFKETHEKLCKDWLKLDAEMELEWKKVHADFENWHNDFTDIPAFE